MRSLQATGKIPEVRTSESQSSSQQYLCHCNLSQKMISTLTLEQALSWQRNHEFGKALQQRPAYEIYQ
eukprot:scaffold346067_cov42-Prasinocladus_malaysianus.AAC.1